MKKLISIPVYALFGTLILFSSCKRTVPPTITGSGNLDAGKAAIALTSSTSFGGSTTFDVGNTLTTTAVTQNQQLLRNISLACNDVSGTNTRSVMIMIITPADASTTSGSLTGDLSCRTAPPSFLRSVCLPPMQERPAQPIAVNQVH